MLEDLEAARHTGQPEVNTMPKNHACIRPRWTRLMKCHQRLYSYYSMPPTNEAEIALTRAGAFDTGELLKYLNKHPWSAPTSPGQTPGRETHWKYDCLCWAPSASPLCMERCRTPHIVDSGVASEANLKEKPAGHQSCGTSSSSVPRALRQPGWLTPAVTMKSDAVLPSGEPLHSGTGVCGSCEGAPGLSANPAAEGGAYRGPFTCWAWKESHLHPWKTARLQQFHLAERQDRDRAAVPGTGLGISVGDDQSGTLSPATSTEAANDNELQKWARGTGLEHLDKKTGYFI